MKKFPILIYIVLLIVISGCGRHFSSTSSELYVDIKAHSYDYKKMWIVAHDPNSKKEKTKLKIMIKDPMVWNLIEVHKKYFTSYSKHENHPWTLDQIENINDKDTIR